MTYKYVKRLWSNVSRHAEDNDSSSGEAAKEDSESEILPNESQSIQNEKTVS